MWDKFGTTRCDVNRRSASHHITLFCPIPIIRSDQPSTVVTSQHTSITHHTATAKTYIMMILFICVVIVYIMKHIVNAHKTTTQQSNTNNNIQQSADTSSTITIWIHQHLGRSTLCVHIVVIVFSNSSVLTVSDRDSDKQHMYCSDQLFCLSSHLCCCPNCVCMV